MIIECDADTSMAGQNDVADCATTEAVVATEGIILQ